jgi:phosphoribosylformylglycinamidine synthase subunit PurSL
MTTNVAQPPAASAKSIARIEVHPKQGQPDPHAAGLLKDAQAAFAGLSHLAVSRVFLIESALPADAVDRITAELLTDPVNQASVRGSSPSSDHNVLIEVHYQPGVMDPVAQSTQDAICEMLAISADQIQVRTGFRYDLHFAGADYAKAAQAHARAFAQRFLANTVIQHIYEKPFSPERFAVGSDYQLKITSVPFVDLDNDGLIKMSREAHLFLSLDEMQAIQNYYKALSTKDIKREPRDIELETLAQTWSEHCVHKTLKATIRYTEPTPGISIPTANTAATLQDRPGHELNPDGSVTINNLLKSTVAAATFKLMKDEPAIKEWCISVFKDNSGIVKFDDEDAVCIKVETHNHPSAIEPYGGAATGIGGCIRDVMGTGLGARPIANTDVFCAAFPDTQNLPKGVIHPKRVLQQVVAGVRDYGNRMGIPTINGAVAFHPDYLANPLVFAGCIGLIPLDKCFGVTKPGDRIIALGGRTGRDGIHGATFSSDELTVTHADEFAHAVQIGNAITQKKTLDALLQARDQQDGPLYSGMTDCGAGGFSSAVGEMAKDVGARVDLERAPLKYQGLSYTEVWISEAQERMVLSVPADKLDRFLKICAANDVEACDLGQFGHNSPTTGKPALSLFYKGTQVGELDMHFLHEGIPTPTRTAKWQSPLPLAANALALETTHPKLKAVSAASVGACGSRVSIREMLLALLKHPNIASKHWIIRQYDHEVQGGSVVKPLVGLKQDGPSDASVIRPKLASNRGIAVGCGLQTGLSEKTLLGDSYWMTLAAIDEAVRNVVCVGADPSRIAILDNFCWPRCDNAHQFGSLVRAAQACYDGALAYKTPFVSGKDSLSNQFTTEDGKLITIPQTLLITALGIVPDVMKSRTMDAKSAGNLLLIVGLTGQAMGGSHASQFVEADIFNQHIPKVDLTTGPRNAKAVAALIQAGLIASAHDCSDGGMLTAAAEMAFAGNIGLDIDLEHMPAMSALDDAAACFAETPSRYLLEVSPNQVDQVIKSLRASGVAFGQIGRFSAHHKLSIRCSQYGKIAEFTLEELKATWLAPLDW